MAWSVDRLGRSLQDLVHFLDHLRATRVELFLHQQGLDTTSPAGRAMFGMLSVFSEFERAIIQERIAAGMARAKAKGTKSGKPIGRPRIARQLRTGSARHIGLAVPVCAIWLRSFVLGGRLCVASCVVATETP